MSILQGKTFYIKPYGCQMNFYDADKIQILLQDEGMTAVQTSSEADVIILVTCHIREKAKHKVYTELGFLKKDKKHRLRQGKTCIIAVGGCVAQAVGEKMFRDIPTLNVIFGTQTYHRLPGLIKTAIERQEEKIQKIFEKETLRKGIDSLMRVTKTDRLSDLSFDQGHKIDHIPPQHASKDSEFLAIQEGCNKFCTYCVVPYTRGREIFRQSSEILNETRNMVQSGIRNITLLGQNVNAYWNQAPQGYDCNYDLNSDPFFKQLKRTEKSYDALARFRLNAVEQTSQPDPYDPKMWNFAQLIYAVSKVPGVERIFYTSSHPLNMDQTMIEAHARIPALLPFVHLPVQSGSDRILKLMNRRHTAAEYISLIERFRQAVPHIAFASDFIVGFPGETQEDFEKTLKLVEKVQYALSYSFKYSRRERTPAYDMPDQIPENEKEKRLAILQDLLGQQQLAFNRNCIGKTFPVFFHKLGKVSGQIIGKSPYMQSVVVAAESPEIHKKMDVLIESATLSSLQGRIINP